MVKLRPFLPHHFELEYFGPGTRLNLERSRLFIAPHFRLYYNALASNNKADAKVSLTDIEGQKVDHRLVGWRVDRTRDGATGATGASMAATKFGRIKWWNVKAYIRTVCIIPWLVRLVKCRSQHCVLALYSTLMKGGMVSGHV